MVGSDYGTAVGENGTILTKNGYGQSWQIEPSPTTNALYSVIGLDYATAVGENGTILKRFAGQPWELIIYPTCHFTFLPTISN